MTIKFTLFFAFLGNSSFNSPLRTMKCNASPATQIFFQFFSFFSSFIIISFFHCVFFFGMRTNLGFFCKSKSLSICENCCFNLPLFVQPSNFTSILCTWKDWKCTLSSNHFMKVHKTNHVIFRIGQKWGN